MSESNSADTPLKLIFARVLYFIFGWGFLCSLYFEGFIWNSSEAIFMDLFLLIISAYITITCAKYALEKTKDKRYDYGVMGASIMFFLTGLTA